MNHTPTSSSITKQRPGRKSLWRFINRKKGYGLQLIELRWPINLKVPAAYFIYFDRAGVTVLTKFKGQAERDRALRLLRHLDDRCSSILPSLDLNFWQLLILTVRYSPYNFRVLNSAIRRYISCCA